MGEVVRVVLVALSGAAALTFGLRALRHWSAERAGRAYELAADRIGTALRAGAAGLAAVVAGLLAFPFLGADLSADGAAPAGSRAAAPVPDGLPTPPPPPPRTPAPAPPPPEVRTLDHPAGGTLDQLRDGTLVWLPPQYGSPHATHLAFPVVVVHLPSTAAPATTAPAATAPGGSATPAAPARPTAARSDALASPGTAHSTALAHSTAANVASAHSGSAQPAWPARPAAQHLTSPHPPTASPALSAAASLAHGPAATTSAPNPLTADLFRGFTLAVQRGRADPFVLVMPAGCGHDSGALTEAAARYRVLPARTATGLMGIAADAPCAVREALADPGRYGAAAGISGQYPSSLTESVPPSGAPPTTPPAAHPAPPSPSTASPARPNPSRTPLPSPSPLAPHTSTPLLLATVTGETSARAAALRLRDALHPRAGDVRLIDGIPSRRELFAQVAGYFTEKLDGPTTAPTPTTSPRPHPHPQPADPPHTADPAHRPSPATTQPPRLPPNRPVRPASPVSPVNPDNPVSTPPTAYPPRAAPQSHKPAQTP